MLPSLDMIVKAVGGGVLLPGVVTAVALLLALRLRRGEPLALGAGLAAGFAALAVTGLAGVVAGVVAGWAIVACWRPSEPVSRAGVPVLAALLPGVLYLSHFNNYGDVPAASYLLVLAAPLCLGLTTLLPFGNGP